MLITKPEAQFESSKGMSEDLPPAYSASEGTTSDTRPQPPPAPQDIKPINFFIQSVQHGAVKAKYVLDPDLHIPRSLLSAQPGGSTELNESNLYVHSNYGAADVEVWIEPRTAQAVAAAPTDEGETDAVVQNKDKKVAIHVSSNYGAVKLKVHDPYHLRPWNVVCHSSYGAASLTIPRSFTGFIEANTSYGRVHFSADMSKNLTLLGEVSNCRRVFIGDISLYREDVPWSGDHAVISSDYGAVRVHYDDEHQDSNSVFSAGFWRKLFGGSDVTPASSTTSPQPQHRSQS